MSTDDTTDDGESEEQHDSEVLSRRTALGLLGVGSLGWMAGSAGAQPPGGGSSNAGGAVYNWRRDVDARGHGLFDLGVLAMAANPTEIADFEGANLSIDANGVLNAAGVADTRTDVSDDGTQVVSNVEDIDFGANLSVVDGGDGTVTVDATDTDTRTDVSDDGTLVVADTGDINFASGISVTDDGDGSVTVDAGGASPWTDDDSDDLLEAPGFDGVDVDTAKAGFVETPALGTSTGTPLEAIVNGERALRIEPTLGESGANIVGGHPSNSVASGVKGATISGGGFDDGVTAWANTVTGDFGAIGGGRENTASGSISTVGGGWANLASGGIATIGGGSANKASSPFSTIGGGTRNEVSRSTATVGGGRENEASGLFATVGGGSHNVANAGSATVPGGHLNTASGKFSFAAGRRARTETSSGATHDGAFVFGDSSSTIVRSTRPNQFVVQAGGGARFYSSSDLSTGVDLPAVSGSWASFSTRTAKRDIEPVDPGAVLDTVERLEISTWEYDSEENAVHMGPMAEDFFAAFGLGGDERRIATVDADGVALAAIQGLAERLDDKEARIEALEGENEILRARHEALENRLVGLERAVKLTGAV